MANMNQLVGAAIGALILVVVFAVVPMVGSQVDDATGDLAVDSEWNATYNTDLATGYGLWEDVGSMISLAAVIIVVGVVLGAIMYFRRGQ